MESHFEIIGYSMDFYVDKKYIGSLRNVEKDRNVFGYDGRESSILNEDITLTNKKKIKLGAEVVTELIPICARMLESNE